MVMDNSSSFNRMLERSRKVRKPSPAPKPKNVTNQPQTDRKLPNVQSLPRDARWFYHMTNFFWKWHDEPLFRRLVSKPMLKAVLHCCRWSWRKWVRIKFWYVHAKEFLRVVTSGKCSKEEHERRIAICDDCEFKKLVNGKHYCTGCPVCPVGKRLWPFNTIEARTEHEEEACPRGLHKKPTEASNG